MKFSIKKFLALILAVLMIAFCFTGCDYQKETNDSNTIAVIIDGENYFMDEMKLYTYAAQEELEEAYLFYILYYYGGYDTFWASDWAEALEHATKSLYQTKLLVKWANQNNITLTAEEKEKVQKAAEEFKKHAWAAVKYAGASDALVEKYFTENAIANKVFEEFSKDVTVDETDAAYRRKKLEGMSIVALEEEPKETTAATTAATTEATEEATEEETEAETTEAGGEDVADTVEEDITAEETTAEETTEAETTATETTAAETTAAETTKEAVKYSEDEQKENREKAVADILEKFQKGMEIDKIVELYKGNKFVSVTKITSTEVTPKDGEAEEDDATYKTFAWKEMKTGDYKSCTYVGTEKKDVGYVLHMVDDDDAALRKTAAEADKIIKKMEKFSEVYEPIVKKVKEFHIYVNKLTSTIKYKGQIHDAKDGTETTTEAESTEAEETTAAETTEAEATTEAETK